jgi:hypothetical protein
MTQESAQLVNNGYAPDSMFWSATDLAFYPGRYYDRYKLAKTWPADAVEVTPDVFNTYSNTPPIGKTRGVDAQGNPTWVAVAAPVVTNEQAAALLSSRINNALDYVAKEWGYDKGIDNATTWAASSNQQFAAEGKALSAWRDQVWAWVATLPAGTTSREGMPTPPERPVINSNGAAA